ncbi:hypothetical protein ABT56_06870 [Photobacterium aquae]|uniref:DUF2505 domain-containing protein n=1 Tax=Photobacterium aquae TaxID=1195763 RepID=A0A0J1H6B4_9GAMM|nr:DUF2505 domain-containing protein [Photobacterium aquae]KLV07249.1 hypothetical protein ABT56_06870 [Photobacterium aquae]
MQVTAIHDYKEDLDTLLRYFSEEALIIDKYTKLGGKQVKVVGLEETEDGFTVTTQREMPANVPRVLKSLLGSFNTIKQDETWRWQENGGLQCNFDVEILGVPAKIRGKMCFTEPTDRPNIATVNKVYVDVDSSVPLVGGTLVSFICTDIKEQMQAEYAFLCQSLPKLIAEEA